MGNGSSYRLPLSTLVTWRPRQISALLTLAAWAVCAGLLHASPAEPQAACGAGYCAYFPLASLPLPIKITSLRQFVSCKATCYYVDGVLDLTGTQPVYDVTLEARGFDSAGQLIRTEVITPVLDATLPGQHNRFSLVDVSSDFYNRRYDLSIRSWSTTSSQTYRPLTIVSQEGYVGDFLGEVHGVVRNDQPAALTNIQILAEIDGIGTDYNTFTIARLEPGASAPFQIGFAYPTSGGPYSYTHPVVQGLGQLAP